jgi:hypothetical protein
MAKYVYAAVDFVKLFTYDRNKLKVLELGIVTTLCPQIISKI